MKKNVLLLLRLSLFAVVVVVAATAAAVDAPYPGSAVTIDLFDPKTKVIASNNSSSSPIVQNIAVENSSNINKLQK